MNKLTALRVFPITLFFFACGSVADFEGELLAPEQESEFVSAALHAPPDPTALGSHAVSTATYGSDTQRSDAEGVLTEHLGQVYYPSDMQNGPYPLVLFLHGDHATCVAPSGANTRDPWPCESPNLPIESYRGFDYIAEVLASHGMVVASISANGMNAAEGLLAASSLPREELINRHMNQFDHFNAFGDEAFNAFPGTEDFLGNIDMDRVALVGHSRGGQAVMNFPRDFDDPAGKVRAIMPLAPAASDFVNDIPVGTVLSYCDSDLEHLSGYRGFDSARYAVADDETEKYAFLLPGGNHNFFNAVWSPDHYSDPPQHAEDDAIELNPGFEDDPHCDPSVSGNGRLTGSEQRQVATAYIASFLRRHLLGQTSFDTILKGDAAPSPEALSESVQVSYHAGASDRRDLNRLDDTALFDAGANNLGGSFSTDGFTTAELCSNNDCVDQSRRGHRHRRLKLAWDSPGAVFSNELARGQRNVRHFNALQFRVSTDHNDARNPSPRDIRVRLVDGVGRSRSVTAARFSNAFELPPGEGDTRMSLMSTVRIPMSQFRGINRTDVKKVELIFQQQSGALLLGDLTFSE